MKESKKLDRKAIRRFACGEIADLIQQALDAGAWADNVMDGYFTEAELKAVEAEMRKEAARFRYWSNR